MVRTIPVAVHREEQGAVQQVPKIRREHRVHKLPREGLEPVAVLQAVLVERQSVRMASAAEPAQASVPPVRPVPGAVAPVVATWAPGREQVEAPVVGCLAQGL